MRLTQWLNEPRGENELLDVFLQITRILRDSEKGQGIISPALYSVDNANNVIFWEMSEPSEFPRVGDFKPPETNIKSVEKSDVFSLGMLLYFLLNNKTYYQEKNISASSVLKPRRRNVGLSVIKAEDGKPLSLLMERMTAVEPDSRPLLKDIHAILCGYICRFSVLLKNARTGEVFGETTRSFTGSLSYKFVPDESYSINRTTLAPVSDAPMLIPFRLVKKQYVLEVVYSKPGRWSYALKNESVLSIPPACEEDAEGIDKNRAVLLYINAAYGEKENALICGTDGFSYELSYSGRDAVVATVKGALAVPERIESRIFSLMKQLGKDITDIARVAVYGNLPPAMIRIINDAFSESVDIYELSANDVLKGAALCIGGSGDGGEDADSDAVTADDAIAVAAGDGLAEE